jgi:glycosyltransferase involved in cell wall biosynthesis
MKIGFISQPFDNGVPPNPGGSIGMLTWELARRLSRSCQVEVCAPGVGPQPPHEQLENVRFHRFRLRPDRWLLDRPRGLKGPISERNDIHSVLYYPLYALRVANHLRMSGCDIVHIHNFSQFAPIVRLFNPKAKIVLHMHCDWLNELDRDLVGKRLKHVDAIIGCADYITNQVKTRFPQYGDRCATLYNGADIARFSPRLEVPLEEERKRVLFVGRVSPEKGIHVLLDAFKWVTEQEPKAQLRIVGGPYIPPLSFHVGRSSDPMVKALRRFYTLDYMEYLRERAKGMPENCVSFLGHVAHGDLATLFWDADVFVQPSVWGEPFPLSVVEAMGAGLPVVASRVGGLPESVVDAKTGLLVEPDNPVPLADAILHLVRNKKRAQSMGTAGAARVRKLFSWEAVTVRLRSLYEALTSGLPMASVCPASEYSRDLSGRPQTSP